MAPPRFLNSNRWRIISEWFRSLKLKRPALSHSKMPGSLGSLAFAVDSIRVVLRRRGIEFPAMMITLLDLFRCVKRFIVLISQPDRFAKLFDNVLIRRGRRTADGFIANVGAGPVGIKITARKPWRSRVMLAKLAL